MPDVMSTVNDLKSLPDQALQVELTRPTGTVPAYLVLAEAQRRQTMRQAAQADRSKQPVGSVYDDVIRDMMARQPPPGIAPAGMTPVGSAPPAAPQTPQNFRPAVGMAEGGEVDDEEDDGGDGGDGGVTQMPTKFNLNEAIRETALRHHRDPAELYGIVMAESHGDPNIVSPKGATGLMQLMPGTAQRFGVDDPTDPIQNLEGGATYLDYLDRKFNKNPTLVHAAFNAGEGAVDKYGGMPPFRETKNYVKRVNDLAQQFKGAAPGIIPIEDPEKNAPGAAAVRASYNPSAAAADQAVQSEQPPPGDTSGLASLEPPAGGGPPAASAPETPDALNDNFPRIGLPTPAPAVAQRRDPYSEDNLKALYGTENDMRALPVQQNDREKAIQQMIDQWYAEAQKRKKPGFWDYLQQFGMGMASTPSRNWAQSIAGGTTGMIKGINAQQEDARKQQLEAMGIDLKLDDQMRTQQQKMIDASLAAAHVQETAFNQANTHDEAQKRSTMTELLKGRTDVRRVPANDAVPPGYEVVTPDLMDPSMKYIAMPSTIKLDPTLHSKLLPFLPGRQAGDVISTREFNQAQTEAAKKPANAGIKLSGADALIAVSLGFDPNNITPEQAKQVLAVKNKSNVTSLADIDPNLIKLSTTGQIQPGQRNEKLLAALEPGEQSLVKRVADYQALLPTGSALREPLWQRTLNLAGLYDPTFSQSEYGLRQKTLNDYSPNGTSGKAVNAMGTVSDHIARWESNMQKLANYGGWKTPLNAPKNWWAQFTGDPRIKPVLLDQEAVANELMRAWRQVGAGSEKDIERWGQALGPNSSPAEQAAVVKEMYGLIEGKLKEMKTQYETNMGRPWDFHMLNPEVRKRMAAHGIDVSDITPGATYGAGLPMVRTQADYDALPKGATYMTDKGPMVKNQ